MPMSSTTRARHAVLEMAGALGLWGAAASAVVVDILMVPFVPRERAAGWSGRGVGQGVARSGSVRARSSAMIAGRLLWR